MTLTQLAIGRTAAIVPVRGTDSRAWEAALKAIVFASFLLAAGNASAGCELVAGPCSTDSSGNTYTREQNFGGGYNTYRNGSPYSQTEQLLDGRYRENYSGGGYRTDGGDRRDRRSRNASGW